MHRDSKCASAGILNLTQSTLTISDPREEELGAAVALLSYPKLENGSGAFVAPYRLCQSQDLPCQGYNLECCTCLRARVVSREEARYGGHQLHGACQLATVPEARATRSFWSSGSCRESTRGSHHSPHFHTCRREQLTSFP